MRLIDADEIPYTDLSEGHGFCWVTFWDWIKKMPTIDAIEVVRCKDCQWGKKVYGNIKCFFANTNEPEYHGYEWFCPNGDTKEKEK